MAKNEEDWLELYDQHAIFQDDFDLRRDDAWKWTETLQKGGRLTGRDIYALNCLIGALLGHDYEG